MNTDNSTPETITIQLTQGQITVISAIDADLAQYKWYALAQRGGYCAVRNSARPKRMKVLLHRVILERVIGRPLTKTEFTDHIDGNPLNNRRANLRIATNAENQQNRGIPQNNTSGFKGVYWNRAERKWYARIGFNGKKIHLGSFTTSEAAHEAYVAASKKLHGEFSNTGKG